MRTRFLSSVFVVAILLLLPACGKRSVTVRNGTQRMIDVRVVHDAFLSGDRTLGHAVLEPDGSVTFGPFKKVPLLEPIDLEVALTGEVGDLPLTHRIDKRNISLVVEPAGLETWSGLLIRRDDLRYR